MGGCITFRAQRATRKSRLCRDTVWLVTAPLLLVAGCASTQLNMDTRNLNQSTGRMEVTQVLDNITAFLDDDSGYAVPSQIVISGGQAQTQYTLTPQFQYGYSKTDQVVSTQTNGQPSTNDTSMTIGGPVSSSVVNGATSALAVAHQATKVFSPQVTTTFADQWNQSWTIQVINDGDALRRLTTLYRYAANLDEYHPLWLPLPQKAPVIDNPYKVNFGEYAAFFAQEHPRAAFKEVYDQFQKDVPTRIRDPNFKPTEPQDPYKDWCLKVSRRKDLTTAVSLKAYGRGDLFMNNAECLQKFVFLVHDAEGATAKNQTGAASRGDVILRSPAPNSTTFFSIPNPLQH